MGRTPHRVLLLLLSAVGGVGSLLGTEQAWAASGRERSLAIFAPQRMPLAFDHALHLEQGAECVSCHDNARKSLKASDLSMPAHPECESCHDIEAARQGKKVDPKAGC